jgi:Na+/H+ antiporter NhaD/arsenite permease-like protein
MAICLASEIAEPAAALPWWTVLPFAAYLLVIALAPIVAGRFWEKNRNKLILAVIASLPVVCFLILGPIDEGPRWLFESIKEYVVFIALLASLFIISGGIYLKGSSAGTPVVNTMILGIGAVLASFIGTTGASMLLIRPLLRANEKRRRKSHIVIFFIFIVSNCGGLLTPLGDPPLFLGFMRGVPFFWTFTRLLAPWAVVNGALLAIFNVVDQVVLNKEERERAGSQLEEVQQVEEPLRIQGGINFLWLLGVLAANFLIGTFVTDKNEAARNCLGCGAALEDIQKILMVAGMGAMAALSLWTTNKEVRRENKFTRGPIIEVAVIFFGIFITMVTALKFLEQSAHAAAMNAGAAVEQPWEFFWATGALSSFLDNAPTYLVFSAMATGVVNGMYNANLSAANLGDMIALDPATGAAIYPHGALLLAAVSCGAVLMGANTYIGNGPNFMVKAIAEENKVKMPGFFGYMAWSIAVLIPLYILVTLLFFVQRG